MTFYPLEDKRNLTNGYRKIFEIGGFSILLIHSDNRTFIIENKCGHFGYPMDSGEIKGKIIICPQHRISFDLDSGEIDNRPYENADPIRVFQKEERNGQIGIIL